MVPKYISAETMNAAGFNEWATSISLQNIGCYSHCDFHVSHLEETNKNLVIVSANRKRENNKTRRDVYFSTFTGKDISERDGPEIEEYTDQLIAVIQRKNR